MAARYETINYEIATPVSAALSIFKFSPFTNDQKIPFVRRQKSPTMVTADDDDDYYCTVREIWTRNKGQRPTVMESSDHLSLLQRGTVVP